MLKDFCINPLIKITIQSKALFTIALHCATVPNAASERQTLPPLYNRMNLMSSLPLNVGRQADSPYFRTSRRHTFKMAGYPACKIAGMQERRNDGKRDSLLSDNQACVMDRMTDGTNARTQSRLIGCLNKALLLYCKKAGKQQFPQASLIAILQERQHEIRTARAQACKTENRKM